MADYTDSRSFGTKAYPVETLEATNLLGRVEAFLVPKKLISRHLKGIDLKHFTPDDLKDQINRAANYIELHSNLHIYKTKKKERLPFDRALYKQFVFTKLSNGPILSVDKMGIVSSNGENIYNLPATWIETGLAHKRQINLIPILSIFGAAGLQDGQASNAGLIFLRAINNYTWLPAFFTVEYTVGISHVEGKVPVLINELIGLTAAIRVLSEIQALNKYSSTSISQEGVSQTSSSAGTQIYKTRIEDLEKERRETLQKIKSKFSVKYFFSNI